MYATQHASARIQQRNISPFVIDLLMEFGASEPAGEGASKLYFDKQSMRKIKAYVGPLAGMIEAHLDVYAVVAADTQLITVGHLYERIRRQ
jgi:hypothetical protein